MSSTPIAAALETVRERPARRRRRGAERWIEERAGRPPAPARGRAGRRPGERAAGPGAQPAGIVAQIALALGEAGINIVDMALYPAPDMRSGAIALWVAGEGSAERAAQLIAGLGYAASSWTAESIGGRVALRAGDRLAGELVPPPDKSISHRAAILGAMSDGRVRVRGYLRAADTRLDARAVRALGAGSSSASARAPGRPRAARRRAARRADPGAARSTSATRNSAAAAARLARRPAARPLDARRRREHPPPAGGPRRPAAAADGGERRLPRGRAAAARRSRARTSRASSTSCRSRAPR